LYRQKSIKKTPNGKLAFTLALPYGSGAHLAFGDFMKIDVCSDSFPLAWAFVVVQGF
jgi:hypothetical protein